MNKGLIKKDTNIAILEQYSSKVVAPAKLISLVKAVTYYNNFYNTRIAFDNSDKTRAVWFEFEMLESYFERVTSFCSEQNIEITRFVFLLGAEDNGKRTVFLAPATYDERLDLHRAFSFDNGEITYLHRFAGENYSTETKLDRLQSPDQSLVLSSSGHISSARAIQLYNNYYDFVTGPFSETVEFDTRFVWYEKGEYEKYLTYLKTQSKEYDQELTGVNVIFASIDNSPLEGEYSNHLTLFFAPTIENNTTLLNLKSNERLDLTKETWKFINSKNDFSQTSSMFNYGNSGPPPVQWD
ncbi:hypothetical protein L0P88_16015 [Muricauda sp. SCSIO 64092]|uniref:hypothetical protein n=1 Tax=Allomuricauda sp. SCSIO 64092 TaxID=2908842 RepID=UPI001FF5438A|nr:hypothetical protein [Muricauda sp. SCSIO 64092]UOY05449.1 hypothetical protein L0P88_16015 [Muricauda sp. SCSIO 64092]